MDVRLTLSIDDPDARRLPGQPPPQNATRIEGLTRPQANTLCDLLTAVIFQFEHELHHDRLN